MLVAFHSSPFSAPLQTNVPNRGFELNVDILYTDSDSYDYAQGSNKNLCEFHINASNPGLCAMIFMKMHPLAEQKLLNVLNVSCFFFLLLSVF